MGHVGVTLNTMEKRQVTHQNLPLDDNSCAEPTTGSSYQPGLPWFAVDVLRKAEDLSGGTRFELNKVMGAGGPTEFQTT